MVNGLAGVLQDLVRSGELYNAVDVLHRSANLDIGKNNNGNSPVGSESTSASHSSLHSSSRDNK